MDNPEPSDKPKGRLLTKWDFRFLQLAQTIATWSKDPSTQVGAVIVRPDRTIASLGFNGFARGVDDSEDRLTNRDTKLLLTVHAEENAILSSHERLSGYWLYTSHHPCAHCASRIVQAGIGRVICMTTRDFISRWEDSVRNSRIILSEGGIPVDVVEILEQSEAAP